MRLRNLKNKNGVIVWEGDSQIDGEPIVLILSGLMYSANDKTGNMLQTYILRQDVHPVEAIRSGDDYSICGNCSYRGRGKEHGEVRTCYVRVETAPAQIWRIYNQDGYEKWSQVEKKLRLTHRELRMGSYGDPAAVPFSVWQNLLKRVHSHTGYTSQWRHSFSQPFRGIVQASCSNLQDYLDAKSLGWMTYTTLPNGHSGIDGAMKCVNESSEKTVQCQQCMLCDGVSRDITVTVHGTLHKQRHFEEKHYVQFNSRH